jgi:chromosomal replication initiator protein DnaA
MFSRSKKPQDTTAPGGGGTGGGVHKRLGDFLLDQNIITQAQLDEAVRIQKAEGGFIGQILVRLNYTTQEQVASCLVKQCKIPHLNLLDYDIDVSMLALIPEQVCQQYNLLPIDKLGRILTVAMVDPLDIEALEAVRAHCADLRIKPILCNWEHFDLVARKVFSQSREQEGDATLTAESFGLATLTAAPEKAPAEASPPPSEEEHAPPPAAVPASAAEAESLSVPKTSSVPAAAPAGLSQEALAAAMRESMQAALSPMRDAMQEMMAQNAALMKSLAKQGSGNTPAEHAAPPPADISQSIQEGVSAAFESVMREMTTRMAPSAPETAGASLSADSLASAIHESVGGAMQEAMAGIIVQLRAQNSKADSESRLTDEGMKTLADSIRQSLENSQQAQMTRLSEITEALLQSVRQQGLEPRPERKRKPHAVVSAFMGADGSEADAEAVEAAARADEKVMDSLESDQPQEAMTFDNFLPGDANAFTYKLSGAVAAKPGTDYNPFFLFGRVGTGKTHLINAIGNEIRIKNKGMRVGYVSASRFARCMQQAMQENTLELFREAWCHWDVLILDDIQFLGGRVEAQEEFFHIFNVLYKELRQIIIASDKAPDQLGLMEKRLISRFGSGIVAELRPPEMETRLAILRQLAVERGQEVPESILTLIAMRVSDDVRRMTGALRKIMAYAKLVGQEMSHEMADEILHHLGAVDAA